VYADEKNGTDYKELVNLLDEKKLLRKMGRQIF
jgi:hypothetical protein